MLYGQRPSIDISTSLRVESLRELKENLKTCIALSFINGIGMLNVPK